MMRRRLEGCLQHGSFVRGAKGMVGGLVPATAFARLAGGWRLDEHGSFDLSWTYLCSRHDCELVVIVSTSQTVIDDSEDDIVNGRVERSCGKQWNGRAACLGGGAELREDGLRPKLGTDYVSACHKRWVALLGSTMMRRKSRNSI